MILQQPRSNPALILHRSCVAISAIKGEREVEFSAAESGQDGEHGVACSDGAE